MKPSPSSMEYRIILYKEIILICDKLWHNSPKDLVALPYQAASDVTEYTLNRSITYLRHFYYWASTTFQYSYILEYIFQVGYF